jgi:hypothetical protein
MASETFRYVDRRLASAGDDAAAVRKIEASLNNAGDLTRAERETLRERIALTRIDAAVLRRQCEAGRDAACRELDRRGIEPPAIELGPPPVIAT